MNKIVKEYFMTIQSKLPNHSKTVEIDVKALSDFLKINLTELKDMISNMFYNSIPFSENNIIIETKLINELI